MVYHEVASVTLLRDHEPGDNLWGVSDNDLCSGAVVVTNPANRGKVPGFWATIYRAYVAKPGSLRWINGGTEPVGDERHAAHMDFAVSKIWAPLLSATVRVEPVQHVYQEEPCGHGASKIVKVTLSGEMDENLETPRAEDYRYESQIVAVTAESFSLMMRKLGHTGLAHGVSCFKPYHEPTFENVPELIA